ncbi:pectate lyase [Phenylobacterium sp.]|uniref:pectate lyase n=1 Tax=Phenylobacterium sp. TaxID=1871053 RepID=UPI002EDB6E41
MWKCLLAALLISSPANAAVVSHMTPAPPLTAERLAELPAADRLAWKAYLDRSEAARKLNGAAATPGEPPSSGNAAASMPLDRPAAWYVTPEARHVADVIVSFQTPGGGWGKNSPRNGPIRQPGQPFSAEADYVGTLDNDATVTELRFLARVISAGGAPHRDSFVRGLRWLLAAQYPNGGWPQVWPLVGGYHDAVTFNDGAMVAAVALLGDIAAGRGDYAFVDAALRREAEAAWRRGLACLLAAQAPQGGWPQQADTLTLAPVGARNFEPAALAGAESAEILSYLMNLPDPSPQVVRAVHAGVAWLRAAQLPDGRWARFTDLASGRPIFGDRDRTIHDDVADLSPERRGGYAWYGTGPAKVLAKYEAWARTHPQRS